MYALTNFETVDEVKAGFEKIRVNRSVIPAFHNQSAPVRMTLHDAGGKSIVVEYLKGELVITDNPTTVMTNDPAFRIVVLEKERAAKAGNITEQLGTYNPRSKALTLNEESVKKWIAQGAQPTDSIRNLLITKGIIQGKKVNVLPKKSPIKKEQPAEAPAAPAPTSEVGAPTVSVGVEETAPEVVEETVVEAPTEAEVVAEALPAPTLEEVGAPTESVGAEEEVTPEA